MSLWPKGDVSSWRWAPYNDQFWLFSEQWTHLSDEQSTCLNCEQLTSMRTNQWHIWEVSSFQVSEERAEKFCKQWNAGKNRTATIGTCIFLIPCARHCSKYRRNHCSGQCLAFCDPHVGCHKKHTYLTNVIYLMPATKHGLPLFCIFVLWKLYWKFSL